MPTQAVDAKAARLKPALGDFTAVISHRITDRWLRPREFVVVDKETKLDGTLGHEFHVNIRGSCASSCRVAARSHKVHRHDCWREV